MAANLTIARMARGMQQLTERTRHLTVHFPYVKARNGSEWTELADIGAKIGAGVFGQGLSAALRKPL